MSDIKNVHLGFSCPFRREDMAKTDLGHYCTNCAKEVIDFTNKSQADLNKWVTASGPKVCGSFKTSQLSQSFLKYAAITAIAGSALLSACQSTEILPNEIEVDEVEIPITGEITFQEDELAEEGIIFGIIESEVAVPVGGIESFYKALYKELDASKWQGMMGRIFIRLTINEKGKVTNVEVLRGIDAAIDKEVLRAVKAINFPFEPASFREVPKSSKMIIPVRLEY